MEPKIITPVVPTFFFDEYGEPHRVNALILKEENLTEEDKQQLDCIDDEGFVMTSEKYLTNPQPESYLVQQLRKWFFWCGDIEDLKCNKYYERAMNLGLDFSDFAKNKDRFYEHAEQVYESYEEDRLRRNEEETTTNTSD